jgi:predicted metal-dependent peptidase
MLISPVKIEGRGHFAKAKVQLVLNHPFFGVLALHLPTVPVSPAALAAMGAPPTAAVDGRKIYYNPKWVDTLTEKQRLGLLAHEVLHPALKHMWRRGNRERGLWLMATDYAVNDIIMRTLLPDGKPAFELPPGGLYDKEFEGMAAEQIYALLKKEKDEQKEQEEQDQKDGKPGKGKGKSRISREHMDGQLEKPVEDDGEGKKGKPGKEEGKPGKGKAEKDKAEAEKKEGGGGKPEKGDPEAKKNEPSPEEAEDDAEGDEPGEGDGQGEGQGEDEGDESEGDEGEGEDEGDGDEAGADQGDGADDADGSGDNGSDGAASADQSPGEEGHPDHACGDIEEANGELDEFWEGLLNQAAMVAKARGNLPAALARLVLEVSAPKVPWQQIIEQYVNEVVRDDYDMMKQDRRFMQSGIYFPELQSNATTVSIIVDTSGSIGEKEIKAAVSEIVGILRCRGIKSARIMSCDSEIHLDVTITPNDELPENYPGGGGTDFRPPFKRLRDEPQGEKPALIVYFTDMYGTFPDKDPMGIPTIWLAFCPAYSKFDALPQPPFGTMIEYAPDEDEDG